MSLTVTIDPEQRVIEKCSKGFKLLTGKIAFDDSYPTGGEALDLSNFFSRIISFIAFEPTAGYIFIYDRTNKKVKVYYADYDAGADGALIEVADTTDLSALTEVYFLAVGV